MQSWGSRPGTVPEPTCGVSVPGKHCSGRPPQAPRLQARPPQTSAAPMPRKPCPLLLDLRLQNLLPWVQPRTHGWTHGAGHTGLGKSPPKTCVPGEFLPEAKFQGPWSKHQPLLTLSLGPRRQLIWARLRGHTGDGERMGRAGSGCRSPPSCPKFSAEAHPAS